MILEKTLEEVENRPVAQKPVPFLQAAYVTFLALVVLALGVVVDPLALISAEQGVNTFGLAPAPHVKAADEVRPAPVPVKGKKMPGGKTP